MFKSQKSKTSNREQRNRGHRTLCMEHFERRQLMAADVAAVSGQCLDFELPQDSFLLEFEGTYVRTTESHSVITDLTGGSDSQRLAPGIELVVDGIFAQKDGELVDYLFPSRHVKSLDLEASEVKADVTKTTGDKAARVNLTAGMEWQMFAKDADGVFVVVTVTMDHDGVATISTRRPGKQEIPPHVQGIPTLVGVASEITAHGGNGPEFVHTPPPSRPGSNGTTITDEITKTYCELSEFACNEDDEDDAKETPPKTEAPSVVAHHECDTPGMLC